MLFKKFEQLLLALNLGKSHGTCGLGQNWPTGWTFPGLDDEVLDRKLMPSLDETSGALGRA